MPLRNPARQPPHGVARQWFGAVRVRCQVAAQNSPESSSHRLNPGVDLFAWHEDSVFHDQDSRPFPKDVASCAAPTQGFAGATVAVCTAGPRGHGQAAELATILELARSGREFAVVGEDVPAVQGAGESCGMKVTGCFRCRSSGTSGTAKTVRRTQRSWIAGFRVNQALWSIGPEDNYAVLGHFGHSLSLHGALEAAHLGADLHLLSGLRPDRQRSALSGRRASVLYATPTQIRLLAEVPARGRPATVPSMRLVLVGGSKLDETTMRAAVEIFPNADIREFYGSAETSFVTIGGREVPPGSVGRAFPGVEIRIGAEGQASSAGEIWVRSPYLFEGYAGDRFGTERWDRGFLSVGEVGRLDVDGNLHLSGRTDRLVTISDRSIHPEEAERFLLRQDGVLDAAVVPEPDPRRGAKLVAFVKLADRGRNLDALARVCRLELGLAAPGRIIERDGLPLLPSGKVDLAALVAELRTTAG